MKWMFEIDVLQAVLRVTQPQKHLTTRRPRTIITLSNLKCLCPPQLYSQEDVNCHTEQSEVSISSASHMSILLLPDGLCQPSPIYFLQVFCCQNFDFLWKVLRHIYNLKRPLLHFTSFSHIRKFLLFKCKLRNEILWKKEKIHF